MLLSALASSVHIPACRCEEIPDKMPVPQVAAEERESSCGHSDRYGVRGREGKGDWERYTYMQN